MKLQDGTNSFQNVILSLIRGQHTVESKCQPLWLNSFPLTTPVTTYLFTCTNCDSGHVVHFYSNYSSLCTAGSLFAENAALQRENVEICILHHMQAMILTA